MARADAASDLAHCRALLARGSKSFHFASRLLPSRMRDPVAAFYAFCRVSDDLVDESEGDPTLALAELALRLDAIWRGDPMDDAVDRALARVVATERLPRAALDALLEGYAWDARGRRYESASELRAYAARVASSVGVVMTRLMGPRDRPTLARAADLGIAMQLTNIARDVGADARAGRVYLPLAWLREEGVDVDAWAAAPRFSPAIGRVVRRLLAEADVLYERADRGIAGLPTDCRPAIAAASAIYRDIGTAIAARGYDSIDERASTTTPRKAWLVAGALSRELWGGPGGSPDGPLPEAAFLVDAASTT